MHIDIVNSAVDSFVSHQPENGSLPQCLSYTSTHLILGHCTRLCQWLLLTVLFGGPDIVRFVVVSHYNSFPCFGAKFSMSACVKCAYLSQMCALSKEGSGARFLMKAKKMRAVCGFSRKKLKKPNVKSDPCLQSCHNWVRWASNDYSTVKFLRCECVAFILHSAAVHNCVFFSSLIRVYVITVCLLLLCCVKVHYHDQISCTGQCSTRFLNDPSSGIVFTNLSPPTTAGRPYFSCDLWQDRLNTKKEGTW